MTPGKVFLVGAGPGDPELVTLRALRCIESADVIMVDRLVDRRLHAHARPEAEIIDVGKLPGEGGTRQGEINSLMVRRAREGKNVVRLKGGDPFVFGRGGEEGEVLAAEGVPFEVVPGVTSAVAAPAYAGIPLTHRRMASSFTVVTGSESPDKPDSDVNWRYLAGQPGTLVVLMGWENLRANVDALLEHGKSPSTPVALVRWGTHPRQQTVVGTLRNIAQRAGDAGLSPPVVMVVGEVVELRERLRWFDTRPLFGKRVLVTRTRAQAGVLAELLHTRGAEAIELPTIEVQTLDDYTELDAALRGVQQHGWTLFTSVNAVEIVFERMESMGLDARTFGGVKVGAIGPSTAKALRHNGIAPDLVPDTFLSEALLEGLTARGVTGVSVLLPRSDIATDNLADGLRAAGAVVEDVTAYVTTTPQASEQTLIDVLEGGVDVATFTSASTVRNLLRLLDEDRDRLAGVTVACIGPVTATAARAAGLKVDIVSAEHTITGLVDALESYFAEEPSGHE